MLDTSFCCLECRLLQATGTACCECGSPAIAALASGSELLKYRNMQVSQPPGAKTNVKVAVGTIAGMAAYLGVALSSLVWLPAAPIAAGLGFAGLGAYAWKRSRTQLVPVPTLDPVAADRAVTRRGVARKLAETVPSIVDGAPVLAEEVVVSTLRGVLFRRVAAVPFVVELDQTGEDGTKQRLVVDGTLRIALPATEHAKLAKGDPRATALGLPPNLAKLRGTVETAAVHDGDRIAVTGEITSELVPALAFHRDAGTTDVMRGRAKAVVIVGPDRD